MLKDYFDSTLSPYSQDRIMKVLQAVDSWCVFPSYGQARAYRAANCAKDENGRYDYSILLYDGFYYVLSHKCRRLILNHIVQVRRDEDYDLHCAAFDDIATRELARDGIHPNK